ncbi:MAG: hypothetical protein J7647_31700, partial [Cyanobacteria bacterium SBLK]|nr:hypothetical protein [Cyanobacteria bacterium SBLK]
MKVKYLTTMAAVSLLSLGLAVGCANPCAAKEKTEQADPCAAKEDPCAGKDPCAAKEDPCAGKDPCAAKEDPCAGK